MAGAFLAGAFLAGAFLAGAFAGTAFLAGTVFTAPFFAGTTFFATVFVAELTFFAAARFATGASPVALFCVPRTGPATREAAFAGAGRGARPATAGGEGAFGSGRSGRPATLPIAFLVLATAFVARATIERRGEACVAVSASGLPLDLVILWGIVG